MISLQERSRFCCDKHHHFTLKTVILLPASITWTIERVNPNPNYQSGFVIKLSCTQNFSFYLSTLSIDIRELKHQAFLLSRRSTGIKLLADVPYLNTSCGRGNRHGGLQATFCLHVGLSEIQNLFYQRNGFKHRTKGK